MNNATIKETLEKQLQLLSERSELDYPGDDLAALTNAMIRVVELLCTDDLLEVSRVTKNDEACCAVNIAGGVREYG